MRLSSRLNRLTPYLFVEINRVIAEKRAQGERIISLAIGDPDMPTPEHIITCLCQEAHNPENHRYPETAGLPELRIAIAKWYKKRFDVDLDPENEVLPLIGSKEGIGHIAFCLLDSGDIALIPDPAYPVYRVGTMLAGGEPYFMPLREENNFLPALNEIPAETARKAKVIWLNYPNNPTGAVAGMDFFERVVGFARRYDIAVCHDAPYTEIAFDGYKPVSFLEVEGAKDVGIEFHSFSKTYNMTGWRIGMAVGNARLIRALRDVKSNLDSGIPQAIQKAAIAALEGPQECAARNRAVYEKRRNLLAQALKSIGLDFEMPQASLYFWVKVPDGYTSTEFTKVLLEQIGVVVTPGTGYGPSGEGYIRMSLTVPDDEIKEAVERLSKWKVNLT
jgi:LL-diaminopimelate aminotransferase